MSTRQLQEARRRLSTRLAGAKAQGEEARQQLQTRLATKLAGARRLVESTAVKQAKRTSTPASSDSLDSGAPPSKSATGPGARFCSDFDDVRVLAERVERERRDPATGRWGSIDGAVVTDLDLGPEWAVDCRAQHRRMCDAEGYTYAPTFNELEGVLASGTPALLSGLPSARQHEGHRVRQRKWVRLAPRPEAVAHAVVSGTATARDTTGSSSQGGRGRSTGNSHFVGRSDPDQRPAAHDRAPPYAAAAPPSSSSTVSSPASSAAARSASDLQLLLGKRLVLPGAGDKTGAYGHLWQAGEGQRAPEWLEPKLGAQSSMNVALGGGEIDALEARLETLVAAQSDREARLAAQKAQLEAQLGEQRRKLEFLRRKYKQLHATRDGLQQDIRAGVAQRRFASDGAAGAAGKTGATCVNANGGSDESKGTTDREVCEAKLSTLRKSAEKVRADVALLEQRAERALQRIAEAGAGAQDADGDVHNAIRRALQSICTTLDERKLLRRQYQQLADDKKRLFDALVSNRALQSQQKDTS